ncbi:MAG: hypothetical protein FD157_272 [Rhodocyclaceae bacterium]|nr:MAG: hypothetical protein FD157_272 [Rhodocyclaceae bacterium]TND02519.1 MAG: hypothetical protein FD118_1883 [Rhodocyclaceae bacterium]
MAGTKERRRALHRGAPNNPQQFASFFLKGRLRGFEKDMRICLTGIPSDTRQGLTHAYFPALTTCCGMLEYLAGLYAGRINGLGKREVAAYARYLPQPDYDDDAIRVLFDAFRNAVAHRGIASGVWVDKHPHMEGRRLTWKVLADTTRPALQIVASEGEIRYDSPWPCAYTHRVHIHLGRLWRDIRDSVDCYLAELVASEELQGKFMQCMKQLYPA